MEKLAVTDRNSMRESLEYNDWGEKDVEPNEEEILDLLEEKAADLEWVVGDCTLCGGYVWMDDRITNKAFCHNCGQLKEESDEQWAKLYK